MLKRVLVAALGIISLLGVGGWLQRVNILPAIVVADEMQTNALAEALA